MTRYLIRRLLLIIPTALLAVTLVFFLFRLVPGDVVRIIAGERATEEEVEQMREQLGLNEPLLVQYGRYMWGLARGDLGRSLAYRREVLDEILNHVPATLELALAGVLVSTAIGVTTGVISAVKRNTIYDYISMAAAISGICIPNFWLGLLLIMLFSVSLGWLPTGGRGGGIEYLILPTIALSARLIAVITRLTRSSLLEVIAQDYIRTGRAKGLSERILLLRHALRNALIPLITMVGLQFGALLAGSIVVEIVFAWPGMGSLLINAINTRDYPMVQGIILVYTVAFIIVNLLTDLSYGFLDPRLRLAGTEGR
jgi:ABC-type dipeptide/oligopeptide/nickel transport system permease component